MKDRLTHEDSHRLVELGVNEYKASKRIKVYQRIDAVYGYLAPIFTIEDILSFLPTEITDHIGTYGLRMEFGECGWSAYYVDYGIDGDDDEPYADGIFIAPELIDVLFELLVWCITNKYLKL